MLGEPAAGIRAAVFFDFDGTLLDTETTVLASWEKEYEHHGHVLDRRAWLDTVGTEGRDRYADLEEFVGQDFDLAAVQARRRAREAELVADLRLRAGVARCLDDIAAWRVLAAVVSSSPRDWVVGHLKRLQILDRFDAVITREDAARGKPHPDLYLTALARLGVASSQVVVVEDSYSGVAAAVAAGLAVIAVPNPVTADQDFSHAALVVGTDMLAGALADLMASRRG